TIPIRSNTFFKKSSFFEGAWFSAVLIRRLPQTVSGQDMGMPPAFRNPRGKIGGFSAYSQPLRDVSRLLKRLFAPRTQAPC
ncbi:hypothetical protein MTR62_14190, partial [Novosphingobium sp. 1949]